MAVVNQQGDGIGCKTYPVFLQGNLAGETDEECVASLSYL
jgi:hypothetical protein